MRDYKKLISKLTLEQKALLLSGVGLETNPIPELGIRKMVMCDGPSGVRNGRINKIPGGNIAFAPPVSMAASWDRQLVREIGVGFAKNCIEAGIDMILAPSVNLLRNPLCGRNYEYFSEDPVLAGELSAEFINGVQSEGVGTSLKHFAMNHQERFRNVVNAECDERTIREMYLRVFEIAVKKSNPTSVMCAYNKVNGHYCSENKKLLTKILREEWGYDGMLISDWGAVHNLGKALKAGMDLQMPHNEKVYEDLVEGLEKGWCTMEDIDRAVENNLKTVDKILDAPKSNEPFDREKLHELAQRAAADGMVLLKNDDNILPIDPKKIKKIAVMGKFAEDPVAVAAPASSGSVTVDDESIDKPLDYIRKYAEENGIEVTYTPLFEKYSGGYAHPVRGELIPAAVKADMVLFFTGYHPCHEVEGDDRPDINLPYNIIRLATEAARVNPNTVMIQSNGSAIAPYFFLGKPKAILQSWLTGEGGGKAIADILFGKVNPSGKLPMTFMNEMDPELECPGDSRKLNYKEGQSIGYRYYDNHPDMVWYPFGYGLSYTTFEYSNLIITPENSNDPKQIVKVKFDITNTGKVAGKEVAQVYVKTLDGSIVRPIKDLRGFEKIHLEPGETKTVTIELDDRAFAYYNLNDEEWHVESGEYEIMVAASATDIRLSATYSVSWDDDYTINREEWDDKAFAEMLIATAQ